MAKIKSHAMDRGYLGCCDGIDLCFDCDYHVSTSHYYSKYRPKEETWYKKTQKKSEKTAQKIREYFKKNQSKLITPF